MADCAPGVKGNGKALRAVARSVLGFILHGMWVEMGMGRGLSKRTSFRSLREAWIETYAAGSHHATLYDTPCRERGLKCATGSEGGLDSVCRPYAGRGLKQSLFRVCLRAQYSRSSLKKHASLTPQSPKSPPAAHSASVRHPSSRTRPPPGTAAHGWSGSPVPA